MTSIPKLSSLLRQTTIEDPVQVLEAANAALKQSKNDLEAQHAKVVALLKLDRYGDAVEAIESADARLKQKAGLDYAYALYKSGKPSQAVEVARKGSGRGSRHVEAQACYQAEDFARAAQLYQQLANRLDGDSEADLRINSGAIDAQLEWAGRRDYVTRRKVEREDMDAFETAYNAACACIARGELKQAEMLLKRSHGLCSSLEDMTSEEKETELLPIRIQLIYVQSRLGKDDEAVQLAHNLDVDSLADAGIKHIAKINALAIDAQSTNPFLKERIMGMEMESQGPDRFFRFQSSILRENRLAADLLALKYSGTFDSTASRIAKETAPNLDPLCNTLSVANAAACARSHTGKEALKLIVPLLEKRPNDVGLLLTIVQLHVQTGRTDAAINTLAAFLSRTEQSGNLGVRFAPGLVGVMVSLFASQHRSSRAQDELASSATYWCQQPEQDRTSTGVQQLLRSAAHNLVESPNPEHRSLASSIFQDLRSRDPNDRHALAGLIASDPVSNTSSTTSLTPISRLTAKIDAAALETAGIAQPPVSADASASTTRKRPAAADDPTPTKHRKPRPSRLPKDYDPAKKPDPERWLPLRDRSTYRPKGKKGKAKANLLSQGAAPAGEGDTSRPLTPSSNVVGQTKPSGQGGGGGGKGRKGGKGKR